MWLFSLTRGLKEINREEQSWANQLPTRRSKQFIYSRSSVRHALSHLWSIPPLEIPLYAPPGSAPQLANGWGFISLSHCKDALLIGWSDKKIGVDIEPKQRSLSAEKIYNRYLSNEEKKTIKHTNDELFKMDVLKKWVTKESAIKWQRGSLARDILEWDYNQFKQSATHRKLKLNVKIHQIEYQQWYIAIASNSLKNNTNPILCTDL